MQGKELENTIAAVQKGNALAFEKLYDAYSSALYGIVLKIVQHEGEAEDILQETFVKVWKFIPSYNPSKGAFFTWVLNIARNASLDRVRKNKKIQLGLIQNDDSSVYEEKGVEIKVNHIGLEDLLKALPDEQKQIVDYLYYRGYTQKETAEKLSLPLGTVKSRSRLALKALKEMVHILVAWI